MFLFTLGAGPTLNKLTKKIFVHDIGDYDRDPNVYYKNEYSPFGIKSETWVLWYFKLTTVRKKIKLYESYGRTAAEAQRALIKARVEFADRFESISQEKYKQLKRKKK